MSKKTEVKTPVEMVNVAGKSGQAREGDKLTGGVMFNLAIPVAEVQRLATAILADGGKVAQLLFAYGLTAKNREKVNYAIPGAVEWKDGEKAPVYGWTSDDTDAYLEALEAASAEGTRAAPVNLSALKAFVAAMKMCSIDEAAARKNALAAGVKNAENDGHWAKVWNA